MTSPSAVRRLVVRRYGVAVAVAEEVALLREEVIDKLRSAMSESPDLKAVDELADSRGGSSASWAWNSGDDPGYWWCWYPPVPEGAKKAYVCGIGLNVANVNGRLAVEGASQMNAHITGLPGAEMREEISDLPAGEHEKWIARGTIAFQVYAGSGPEPLKALVDAALSAATPQLQFLMRLYPLVLKRLGR